MALVKYNDNSISTISSAGQLAQGSLVPIKTLTASGSASLSFVHGSNDVVLDSTYPIYKFEFINCHPQTDASRWTFQASTNTGSSYGVTMTTIAFNGYNAENSSFYGLSYNTSQDLAQSTSFKQLIRDTGSNNDQSASGQLFLFNPSSTTFVKHFISQFSNCQENDANSNSNTAGYFNDGSNAIDGIQFKYSTGNIDSGTIKLYGIKDS